MKTCKDCIHRKACQNIVCEYEGKYAASAYDEDSCCKAFAEICENYTELAEFIQKYAKEGGFVQV